MPQIQVENLSKTFKVARRQNGIFQSLRSVVHREYSVINALQGVSFQINASELVGYIGPNGAGKSTTVKVMSGIMVPDSGYCEIMGQVPWKHRIRHVRQIGVVFGQRSQLWWDVPVADSFDLLKDIYKIPQSTFNVVRDELVSGLGLENLLNIPVRQLSLGQKMRCELAASLLHQPALLFLDEPTIGLDAISKLAVRDFIRKINRDRGVTVILTTHDMDDIEALCSRVMLIGKGRILLDGTINQMRSTVMPERILKIEFASCPQDLSFTDLYLKHFEGNQAEFRFNPQKITAAELVHRISQKQNIKDFTVENPPIEEIVARMYGNLKI